MSIVLHLFMLLVGVILISSSALMYMWHPLSALAMFWVGICLVTAAGAKIVRDSRG